MGRKSLMAVGIVLLAFLIAGFSGVASADDETYRSILKTGGLLAAILGVIGIALAGYFSGKDYSSYTGWERYTHGAGMFFNRKPFRRDRPTYGVEGQTRRVKWEESILNRLQTMMGLMMPPDGSEPKWLPDKGPEALPEPIRTFFFGKQREVRSDIRDFWPDSEAT